MPSTNATMKIPEVRLLDARATHFDETELRAWARATTDAAKAPYTSRSYRYPFALVAWFDQPVGIDIERIEPHDDTFATSICVPAERELLSATNGDRDTFVSSLWSSKEALSKALGDAVLYDPRRLESPIRWPEHRSGPWHAEPYKVAAEHVAWICWRSPEIACKPATDDANGAPSRRRRAKRPRESRSAARSHWRIRTPSMRRSGPAIG
jgi:hypothetical protein